MLHADQRLHCVGNHSCDDSSCLGLRMISRELVMLISMQPDHYL